MPGGGGKPRGMNPGRTTQGIDLQSGIVGENRIEPGMVPTFTEQPVPPGHRLDAGIGFEGGPRFLRVQPRAEGRRSSDFDRRAQNGLNLLHLVSVLSGHEDLVHRSTSKLEPGERDNLLSQLG